MKKILIIEDDPILIKILQIQFSQEADIEFLVSIDPEEGLRKAKDELPDLILLDLILPSIPGMEVLKILKKDSKTKSIPVIIYSMIGREDVREEALKLGAAEYIIKGKISLEDFMSRVKSILSENF